jgi:long-chain fatty acid transport protein
MSLRRGVLLTLWLGALVIGSGPAQAGGMFLGTHGARPTARGGAFVAGADDLNAIYYNPAGVVLSHPDSDGWSILFDAGLVLQHVAYTRNDAGIERPTVYSDGGVLGGAPLIIPQLAFARTWRKPFGAMSIGIGLWIPYSGLTRYPEASYDTEADRRQVPEASPQRYQLLGLHDGSITRATLMAVLNPVVSFSLLGDKLQLGIGPQLMLLWFRAKMMLNGCPQVMCPPENPDYDALVVAQAFAPVPSLNLGAIYRPLDWLKVGLAFQLPFLVRSAYGTVDTRLPSSELFNGASVEGRRASLAVNLPPILRLGTELTTWQQRLRIELAYTAEFWSVQDRLVVTPQDVSLVNVKGFDTYKLGTVAIERQLQTTHALHLGLEATLWKYVGARLGGMFESGAMPDATFTILSPDSRKGMIAVGAFFPGVRFGSAEWRFDLGYARVIQPDRVIAPEDSQLAPQNPIRPDIGTGPGQGGIGGGRYQVSYDVFTLGLSVTR